MNARLQSLSPDLDGILARLSASLNAEEGEAAAAELLEILNAELATPSPDAAQKFQSAWETMSESSPGCAGPALIGCLLSTAHYCFLANRSAFGLQPAAKATSYARRLEDKRLVRKALTIEGIFHAESGDLPSAIDAYSEALCVARELADAESEAAVWNNLGGLLVSATQHSDALQCFHRAVALASGSHRAQSVALANLGICALHLCDLSTGLEAARRSIELNPNPTTAPECADRALAESNYARLLLAAGDMTRAEDRSEAAGLFASRTPSARAEYFSLLIGGLIDVYAGRFDSGLTRLKQTLDYARRHVPSEARDALSICVGGHEAAGQPDLALVYLHELLALNRDSAAVRALLRQILEQPSSEFEGATSKYEAQLTSDAARLQAAVDARLKHLVNAAINAGLASGYDMYRVFRVSKLAELFAAQEGWTAERVERVALAAKLIDVGMIATPEPLLTKTRGLSEGERKVVDDHTRFGAELLAQASLAMLQPCIPVVRFHHERWDGSGPWSLKGEAIPAEGRLVALADAFDAMTHPRPWRTEPLTPAMALREIAAQAGRQFDPELAARFVDFVQREFWKHDRFLVFLGEEGRNSDYVQARERIATMMRTDKQL